MREIFNHSYLGKEQNIIAFLSGRIPRIGLRQLDNLFYQSNIKVNSKPISKDYFIKSGDIIQVFWPYEEERGDLNPRYFPLDMVYENDDFLLINKAPGMACHHGLGIKSITLVDAINYYLLNKNEPPELANGLVHRIDKATSGLILFGKTRAAIEDLKKTIQHEKSSKIYHALIAEKPDWKEKELECKMGRDPENEYIIRVFNEEENLGKISKTHFKVLDEEKEGFLIEAKLFSGLTHQIRVHLHYLGFPIIGDKRYQLKEKGGDFNASRMMLHAQKLAFKYKGQDFEFEQKADWKKVEI